MHLFKRIVTKSELGSKLGLSPPSETWTIPNSPIPYHRPSAKYDRLNDDESDNLPFFTRPAARSGFTSSSTSPIPAVSSSFVFDSIDDAGCFDLWNSLPYELKYEVLKHVSLKDVAALSVSCRLIHQLTNENALWKHWTCVYLGLSLENMSRFGSQIPDWRSYSRFQVCFYKKGCLQSQKVAPTSTARPQPRFAQTACVVDDKIYYVGGQMADKRSDEILAYQPSSGEFEKVNISNYDATADSMPTKEQVSADCKNFKGIAGKVPNFARHQSVQVNGRIYVFGGYDYTFFYNLALFDPVQRTWTYPDVYGDVPAPRSNHSSCVVGNKFYIFGGSVGDNVDKYSVTNDFYCFDTITSTWSRLSSDPSSEESSSQRNISIMQPSGRVGHVMAAVGDFIYLFGGGVWGKVSGWTQQYNDLFIYDTKTNQWEAVTMKNEEKPGVCTYPYVFTVGHNVMIFGGASMTGSTVTNKMYGWDILARKWREMFVEGEDISARSIGTANLVGDEIVLWGGYCGGLLAADNDMFKLKLKM